tara:strand:+ start:892 stop:1095 length:204 start_codon:yes stop_codon:yes gene_type:complete
MKSKFANYGRLVEQMDTTIRDIEIRAYWCGLSHSNITSKKKIAIIVSEFHVSEESVKRAVYREQFSY